MENDSSVFGNTHKGRQRCCAGQRFSCSARSVKESRGSWFTAGSGGTELLPQASVAAPPQPGPREGHNNVLPGIITTLKQVLREAEEMTEPEPGGAAWKGRAS